MTAQNNARALRVPSHGVGHLQDFPPGVSGNPGGRPANYHQARRALQEWASMEGVRRLIELAASPDDRVASVVVLGIFDRAYGKPKEFDPSEERKPLALNASVLSTAEKEQLLGFLRRGLVTEIDPVTDAPQPIEGKAMDSAGDG
jgi:hypothetical protein